MTINKQQGSAHAIVIVILVLALLGTLGFVFYQNFIAKKPVETTETKQETTSNATLPTARLTFNDAAYTFSYPTDWIVEGAVNKDAVSSLTLLSHDKKIRVHVTILGEDMMFNCAATDANRKVRYYEVSKDPVTKLSNAKAYVVEAITDAEGGGYDYKIGLTQDGGDTHAAVGDPYCTVFNVGLASQLQKDGASGKVTQPTIMAEIDFPELVSPTETRVKDMQSVKDLIATDNYKAAVKILESGRKE
jgi:hypothetical protein